MSEMGHPFLKLMSWCGQAGFTISDPADTKPEWMQSSGLDNRQAHLKTDEQKVRIDMHAFVIKCECIVLL